MHLRSSLVNSVWGAASVGSWRRFRLALRQPAEIQRRQLLSYVADNRDTAFGRAHRFAQIRSVEDYQARVPLARYDGFEPWIHAVRRGDAAVLTAAPVERLVPSGGSTAAKKLIPFTAPLRREFSRAIDAWLIDLFARTPALVGGPAYWSITPPAESPVANDPSGVPIGFETDAMYLGGLRQALAGAVMAVPAEVASIHDATAFRYATLLFLLRARELRLMSVWHPSFLEGLLELLDRHRTGLLDDLAAGTLHPPVHCDENDLASSRARLRPAPRRAALLRSAPAEDLRAIWPKLSLVSCWADGASQGPATQLARRTGVPIQPKGLLATEGVVTVPFGGRHPLAVGSHFFEFVDTAGSVRLAQDLQVGENYTVVLTTGGGLYRYRLDDRVRVEGFVDETPSIRLIGKDDRVSDWFGEKLSDGFVASVLQALFSDSRMPAFSLVAPEPTPSGLAYTLFVDADTAGSPGLASRLEAALRRNPQYAWCVDLGQLQPARVVGVTSGAAAAYIQACAARGQKLGDIKAAALRADSGWMQLLPIADVPFEAR